MTLLALAEAAIPMPLALSLPTVVAHAVAELDNLRAHSVVVVILRCGPL
jgi:hypothetical protein